MSGGLRNAIRFVWFGTLGFALLAQILGFVFALHYAYITQPSFIAVGLSGAIEYDGTTSISPIGSASKAKGIVEDSRLEAIQGRPVAADASADAIAKRLDAAGGSAVEVRLRDPRGVIKDYRLIRSPRHRAEALQSNPVSINVRMAVRLLFSLLGAVSLIGSAVLLYRLRSRDAEAMLISFAFLFMAAVIDPPILMWMGLGLNAVIDAATCLWWTAIIIAFAAFPTGQFSPRWLRWTIPVAPLFGIFLAADLTSDVVAVAIGVVPPLLILSAQLARYRRIGPGIERQQIKWAAIGFTAGFVLLGISLLIAALPQPVWSPVMKSVVYLTVVCTFSLAFAVMPLGLLIALLRYRLWEADTVIRQSVSYAALTLFVGFIFTLAADATKAVVLMLFSSEHTVLATSLGALIAVGVFGPARSVVLRWSKQRFDKPLARMRALPGRLRKWRQEEDVPEIGMRLLATLVAGIHADSAALIALTPTGRELIAAHNVEDPQSLAAPGRGDADGHPWAMVKSLEDEDGPIGTLLLGPRSDGNRYNRNEREALEEVLRPIAEALRFARRRTQTDVMRAFEARLAQLEGAAIPKPA